MARLVVVSNRVAVPDGKSGGRAGGLEVAVKAALRNREGVWFGWSGKIARKGDPIETKTIHHDNVDYVVTNLGTEDHNEYYNGFANACCGRCCTTGSISPNSRAAIFPATCG